MRSVYHELRNTAPARLLEALRRYKLLDRFTAVVKGFANSYSLTEAKCAETVKSFSLRVLSRVLLDKEENLDNAADRARLCYQVVHHLGQGERQDLDGEGSGDGVEQRHAIELIRPYTKTVDDEEKDLAELKVHFNSHTWSSYKIYHPAATQSFTTKLSPPGGRISNFITTNSIFWFKFM